MLKIKPKEIVDRLKKFIVHDVRKNRILGLYLVIGVMVISYGIYFVVVMYKDISSGGDKRVASKPKVVQVRKSPPPKKKPPAQKKAAVPVKKSSLIKVACADCGKVFWTDGETEYCFDCEAKREK